MNIHLKALGCRLNEAELEQWANEFRQHGHQVDAKADQADLLILNTCAVTGEAARKSRQQIHRLHRDNPQAKLIVTGCHASLSPQQVRDTLGVDLVIDNQEKHQLVATAQSHLALPTMPAAAMDHSDDDASDSLFARGRNRAFIKIQDGCRYRCSYCIVTHARGDERSRSPNDILEQIQRLAEQGIQEIVLTGVQIGGYGHGQDGYPDLPGLVQNILEQTSIPRLRIGSLEPWSIQTDFAQLFKNPRLMPHLHLPLQSGADAILKRMSRQTRRQAYIELIESLQSACPALNISTDIIVGFPGESDEHWHQTLELCDRLRFSHIHIFSYSDRQGTKAASLNDKIPEATKRQRSRQLHQHAAIYRRERLEQQLQTDPQPTVLFEQRINEQTDGQQHISGYTPNYLKVQLSGNRLEALKNQSRRVQLIGLNDEQNALVAEPIT